MKKSVKFSTKITRILVASAAGFCILLGGLISTVSGVGLYRNISTFAAQNTAQSLSDMNLYVQTAVSASHIVTDNQTIVTALGQSKPTPEINNAMTQFQLTTFSVYGAQMYDLSGNNYKTSGTEDLPSLEELRKNDVFRLFSESDRTETYWLRTDCMPGIYNNNRYDKTAGMYTFVTKITDGAQVVGYFLMDFNPYRMLESFFDYRSLSGYEKSFAYFVSGDVILSATSTGEANPCSFIPSGDESLKKVKTQLYVCNKLSADDSRLVVVLPLGRFYAFLGIISGISAACCAICVLFTCITVRVSVRKTLKPLENLTEELNETNRPDDV